MASLALLENVRYTSRRKTANHIHSLDLTSIFIFMSYVIKLKNDACSILSYATAQSIIHDDVSCEYGFWSWRVEGVCVGD